MRTRTSAYLHAPRPLTTSQTNLLQSTNLLLFSEPEFNDEVVGEFVPLIMLGSMDENVFQEGSSAPNSARIAEFEVKSIFENDNTFAEEVHGVNLVEELERDEHQYGNNSFDFPDVGHSPVLLPVRAENPMSNELLRNQLWKKTPPKERMKKLRSYSAPIQIDDTQIF